MFFTSFKDFLHHHKDYILQEIFRRVGQMPLSPYQEFILASEEGPRRINTWLTLLLGSMNGEKERFFLDQERIGYIRATQGFTLENVSGIYYSFQQSLREILHEAVARKELSPVNLVEEIQELNEMFFQGYKIVSASFLKTREERIHKEVTHLQELYDFTHAIISVFELKEIVKLTLNKITALFDVEESFMSLCRYDQIIEIYGHPTSEATHKIRAIMERTLREGVTLFSDDGEIFYKDIDCTQLKRIVSVPILAHGHQYGVLVLNNSSVTMKFTKEEFSFLNQFLYIAAVVLENAFMLKKIEQNRQDLRLLTSKMINIQEDERKHLAADIHDTVAQTLTGISYKIQFCKELIKKDPKLLIDQFDSLLNTIDHAITQSRDLIASLRPELIDTMGLVPALRHHINNFEKETGIKVMLQLPTKNIQMSPKANICLFRVVQEALMNVYRHAGTKNAEVALQKKDENVILVVADNGKGFDMSQGLPYVTGKNRLGLLSMKERVEAAGGLLIINAGINRGCRIEAKITVNDEANQIEEDQGYDR